MGTFTSFGPNQDTQGVRDEEGPYKEERGIWEHSLHLAPIRTHKVYGMRKAPTRRRSVYGGTFTSFGLIILGNQDCGQLDFPFWGVKFIYPDKI